MPLDVNRVTAPANPNVDGGQTSARRTNTTGLDFSSMLSESMERQVVENGITLGSGSTDVRSMLGGGGSLTGGIEQIILAAAASGEVSDAEIALFMLCSMMQSSPDGEFSQLFGMMAAMLGNINGDTGVLRETVMFSDYPAHVLSTVDAYVFSPPIETSPGGAVIPTSAWMPVIPAVTSGQENRSPQALRAVISQFNVETAERYRPGRGGNTYCNIFVWDVTRAMGAEVPYYVDPATGNPLSYPDIKGAKHQGAIAMERWLEQHGPRYGWREVDAATAQRYANEGKAAVTTAGNIGHVQIVCPSDNGGYDPVRGVTIAQAGRVVSDYMHISEIYGAKTLAENIRYFVHE